MTIFGEFRCKLTITREALSALIGTLLSLRLAQGISARYPPRRRVLGLRRRGSRGSLLHRGIYCPLGDLPAARSPAMLRPRLDQRPRSLTSNSNRLISTKRRSTGTGKRANERTFPRSDSSKIERPGHIDQIFPCQRFPEASPKSSASKRVRVWYIIDPIPKPCGQEPLKCINVDRILR